MPSVAMSQIKCPVCGESKFIIEGGMYKCEVCNSIFKDNEAAEIVKKMEEQAENYIGNLRYRLREETNQEILDNATIERLADNILDQLPEGDVVALYYKNFARRFKDRNRYKNTIIELCDVDMKVFQARQIAKTMIRFYEFYVKDAIENFMNVKGVSAELSAEYKKKQASYADQAEELIPSIRRDILIICAEEDYADAQSIVSFFESKGKKCWFKPRNFDPNCGDRSKFMKQVVDSTKSALFINSINAQRNPEIRELMFEVVESQRSRNVCHRAILSADNVCITEDSFYDNAIVCRPQDGLRYVLEALKRDGRREADLKKIVQMVNSKAYEMAEQIILNKLFDNIEAEEPFLREQLLKVHVGLHKQEDPLFNDNVNKLKGLSNAEEIEELEDKYPIIIDAEKLRTEADNLVKAGKVEEGIALYKRATKKNDHVAYYALGDMYFKGKHVTKDIDKAVNYYDLSAKQGNAEACRVLGFLYENGRFIPKDDKKAFEYYLAGAKLGQGFCALKIADRYADSTSPDFSEKDAFYWYKEAAKQGVLDAIVKLGIFYKYGKGTPVNLANAKKCFEFAAARNDKAAMKELYGH